jgi:hypothetical protein
MVRLTALALALTLLVSGSWASDLTRHRTFERLFGVSEPLELGGGLQIVGEHVVLDNGHLTATFEKVLHPEFSMKTVAAQGTIALDAAFFADPVTAAINSLLKGSQVAIALFKNGSKPDRKPSTRDDLKGIDIEKVKLVFSQKRLTGSLHALAVTPEFAGAASYEKASRKLTVTVQSVKIAGIDVPLSVAFFVMGRFMSFSFVTLSKPNVVVNLTPFLPVP